METSPNCNKNSNSSQNVLPDELIINGQQFTNSQEIALKLNDYFASISDLLYTNEETSPGPDFSKLQNFISDRIPNKVFFKDTIYNRRTSN